MPEKTIELDGVFLDLYGTVTSGDRAAVEHVCRNVIADTGLSLAAEALSIAWGDRFYHYIETCNGPSFKTLFQIEIETLRDTLQAVGVETDTEPYAHQLREYWQAPPLQPEAKSFLDSLPIPVCIVSNADQQDAEAVVARYDLRVHEIITSEVARSYKPDSVIFDLALERTGWRRDRVIHVGDSLHSDVGGAREAGLRSGWVNRSHRIHDIGTHEPDHEFEDLTGFGVFAGFA